MSDLEPQEIQKPLPTPVADGVNGKGKPMVRCSECAKRVGKAAWKYHSKTHMAKTFQCTHCTSCFVRNDALQDHMFIKHGDYSGREDLRRSDNPKPLSRLSRQNLLDRVVLPDIDLLIQKAHDLRLKEEAVKTRIPGWAPAHELPVNYHSPDIDLIKTESHEILVEMCCHNRSVLKMDWEGANEEADEALAQYAENVAAQD